MFAISQQLSYMNSVLASMQQQINVLRNENLKNKDIGENTTNDSNQSAKVEELTKSVSKLQVENSTKHVESKKELEKVAVKLEDFKKELKLMETTMTMKTEQFVNKLVKERIEQCKQDIISQVLQQVSCNLPSTPPPSVQEANTNEDYEINVTLAGEDSVDTEKTTTKKTRGRKPKISQ